MALFYSEGSVFENVTSFTCNLPNCGVYTATTQPVMGAANSAGYYAQVNVVNAAIGWKQSNGFYYPPAFVFARSAFSDNTLRHNVVDQYDLYGTGSNVAPVIPGQSVYAADNVTPIDATTILLDVDGTLTGAVTSNYSRTSSVSKNYFFDAPSVEPECNSFGVQTSPYDLVSTVIANVAPATGADATYLSFTVNNGPWAARPVIPIYRQLTLPGDSCASPYNVCGAGGTYGSNCTRASLMMGTDTYQAPYLTMNRGVYYIDTNTQPIQSCCPSCGLTETSTFSPNQWYMIWNIYGSPNTKIKYQVYVGSGFNPATDGMFVRTIPHRTIPGFGALNMPVTPDTSGADFSNDAVVIDGVLFITLDHTKIASNYNFTARNPDELCLPRDVCQLSSDGQTCVVADAFAKREPQLISEMSRVCGYWAVRTSGMYPGEQTTFADCPASGCLGYAFKMPTAFVPQPYASVGAKLTSCFPRTRSWSLSLESAPNDTSCPAPSTPSGFCPPPDANGLPPSSNTADYPGAIVPGVRGAASLLRFLDFGEGGEGFGGVRDDSDLAKWNAAMREWETAFQEYQKSTQGQCA
eukprot:Opistho-2@43807